MREFTYEITQQDDGKQVQDYLMREKGYSRRILTRLKREPEHIRCNGSHIRMVDILHTGDQLSIGLEDKGHIPPNGDLNVPIVYEDEDFIIFNKPFGMPVHPSILHYEDTLANFFSYWMEKQRIDTTFRPINRLDRDTMGLCLVAKNALSAKQLSHAVQKEYVAVVCGVLPVSEGIIDRPIGRADGTLMKREVREDGQPSVTEFEVIRQGLDYTMVKVILHTGRTHQIRVHFSDWGYPLAGDDLYGGSRKDCKTQALCCTRLIFMHPIQRKQCDICINIPKWMNELMG